jgi:hypothetical protein
MILDLIQIPQDINVESAVLRADVGSTNFYYSPLNANPLMFWVSLLNANQQNFPGVFVR